MARFGKTSMSRLEGVHPLLVDWAMRVVTIFDCSVVSGVRDLTTQAEYVAAGVSRTMNSKHLIQSIDGYGHAVDLAPYPIDWVDPHDRFKILAGVGIAVAHEMSLPITWGGDWDGDMNFADQDFFDYAHWQIDQPYFPR